MRNIVMSRLQPTGARRNQIRRHACRPSCRAQLSSSSTQSGPADWCEIPRSGAAGRRAGRSRLCACQVKHAPARPLTDRLLMTAKSTRA